MPHDPEAAFRESRDETHYGQFVLGLRLLLAAPVAICSRRYSTLAWSRRLRTLRMVTGPTSLSVRLAVFASIAVMGLAGCMAIPPPPLIDPPYSVTSEHLAGTWKRGVASIEIRSDGTFTIVDLPARYWKFGGSDASWIQAEGWWAGCAERHSVACDTAEGILEIDFLYDYVVDNRDEYTKGEPDGMPIDARGPRIELHYADDELWLQVNAHHEKPRDEKHRFAKVA